MNVEDYYGLHSGESAAILANGPSLTDHDLSKITCTTIGLNASYLIHEATYHVAADDDWHKAKPAKQLFTGNNIRLLETQSINWSTSLGRGVYLCGCVTFMALQIAAWMGFRTIYMVGLDACERDNSSKFAGHPRAWHPYRDRLSARQRELMGYAAAMMRDRKVINLSPITKVRAFPQESFENVFPG